MNNEAQQQAIKTIAHIVASHIYYHLLTGNITCPVCDAIMRFWIGTDDRLITAKCDTPGCLEFKNQEAEYPCVPALEFRFNKFILLWDRIKAHPVEFKL